MSDNDMQENEEQQPEVPESNSMNLQAEADATEDEFSPPDEKNEARQLNVGNVFGFIMLAVVVILGVILVFAKPKRKTGKTSDDLNKAGSKCIPDLKIKESEKNVSQIDEKMLDEKECDVDEILSTLPPEFRDSETVGTAPVAPVFTGSVSSSSASTRPDTRNSKSPRKVDGIAGQNYVSQSNNNQNIVSAMLGGQNYAAEQYRPYSASASKDEYIEKLQAQGRAVSMAGGLSPDMSAAQQYQSNRENFFENGQNGGAGSGQYLSYASLWEGTIISGALETAINTDNPGLVIARVTENVYSSYDGSFLLIPEGSLLYATYNSSVSYGQNRVQIAWNLLIRPDGYRVELGNMNGVDAQGASGVKGFANNHPFQTLKALGLVALYSVIQTEINTQIKANDNQYVQNALNSTYSEASKIGNKILDKALDIKPTVSIKAGREIKLITNTTLNLPPVKAEQVTRKYVRAR